MRERTSRHPPPRRTRRLRRSAKATGRGGHVTPATPTTAARPEHLNRHRGPPRTGHSGQIAIEVASAQGLSRAAGASRDTRRHPVADIKPRADRRGPRRRRMSTGRRDRSDAAANCQKKGSSGGTPARIPRPPPTRAHPKQAAPPVQDGAWPIPAARRAGPRDGRAAVRRTGRPQAPRYSGFCGRNHVISYLGTFRLVRSHLSHRAKTTYAQKPKDRTHPAGLVRRSSQGSLIDPPSISGR